MRARPSRRDSRKSWTSTAVTESHASVFPRMETWPHDLVIWADGEERATVSPIFLPGEDRPQAPRRAAARVASQHDSWKYAFARSQCKIRLVDRRSPPCSPP